MHCVFTPIGSAGDVHPMLGIAVEMHRRGHAVTFVANSYFQESIRRCGLRFVELGDSAHFHDVTGGADLWKPRRAFSYVFHRAVLPVLRGQYAAVVEHAKEPDALVVANCLGFGARAAREKHGIRLVTLHIQPAVLLSRIAPPHLPAMSLPRWLRTLVWSAAARWILDPTVCPELNRFRAEVGLGPIRAITDWWHSPDGVLCTFPEWFAPMQADWPKPCVQTDFTLWDADASDSLPAEVDEFLKSGEPPIAFTPGSANVFGASFFQAAVEACVRLGRRGVLLTRFADQVPASLPPQVRHFEYVPFARLLPGVAALAHHGGMGTTAQALAAGIPQLIMPLAHDQFDNLARVKTLGVGDGLSPRRFQGRNVAQQLERLLASGEVAEACRRSADRLASRSGVSTAADGLERLANGKKESGVRSWE